MGEDEEIVDERDEPESDYCECNCDYSIEESDWNKCDSCGKPIY